jgi:hypothetical protein
VQDPTRAAAGSTHRRQLSGGSHGAEGVPRAAQTHQGEVLLPPGTKIDAQAYLAITSYAAQKPLAPNTPPQGASLTRTQTQPSTLALTLTRALIRRLLGACRGAGAVNEAAGKDWRLHAAVEFLEEKAPAEYLCCAVDCIAQGFTQSRHHVVLHCAVPGGTNADEPLVFSKFFCSCGESVRHGWVCRHFIIAVHRRIPQAAFQLGLIHDTFFTDPQPSRPSYQVVASPSLTAPQPLFVESEREDVHNEWLLPEPDNPDDEPQTMEDRQFNALLQNSKALFRQVFNGARAAMRVLPHPPPARHATDKPYGVRCAVADIKDKKNTEGAVDLLSALRRVEERVKSGDQILDPQVRRPGGNKQSAAAKATHGRKRAAPATATAAAPKKKREPNKTKAKAAAAAPTAATAATGGSGQSTSGGGATSQDAAAHAPAAPNAPGGGETYNVAWHDAFGFCEQ